MEEQNQSVLETKVLASCKWCGKKYDLGEMQEESAKHPQPNTRADYCCPNCYFDGTEY